MNKHKEIILVLLVLFSVLTLNISQSFASSLFDDFLSLFSESSSSEEQSGGEDSNTNASSSNEGQFEKYPALLDSTEIIEKRTINSKTYRNLDGTYTAVVDSLPVHYKDSQGKWQDVDTNLVNSEDSQADRETTKGHAIVKFLKSSNQDIISIEAQGRKISFRSSGLGKGSNYVSIAPNKSNRSFDKNKAKFQDIYANTDLEFTVGPNGVKEDIILNEYTGNNTFGSIVKAPGLSLIKQDDGSININDKDTGETMFIMPAPFSLDSNQDSPAAAFGQTHYELEDLGSSNWLVKIVVNDQWLSSSDRVFPVRVDPTINTAQRGAGASTGKSGKVFSSQPNIDYYGSNLSVGKDADLGNWRSFAQMTVSASTVPLSAHIISATWGFNMYAQNNANSINLTLNRVDADWLASSLTWNSQPSATSGPGIGISAINSGSNWGFKEWNITDLYTEWHNRTRANYGVMVSSNVASYSNKQFYSAYYEPIASRPKLTIKFSYKPSATIVSPVNAVYTSSVSPRLTWDYSDSSSSDVEATPEPQSKFHSQVSTTSSFSPITKNSGEVSSTNKHWQVSPAFTSDYSSNRTYWWRVRVNDGYSWSDYAQPSSAKFRLDTEPPTGSISIHGGATYSASQDVVLTLTASDSSLDGETGTAGSGLKYRRIHDGSAWPSWTAVSSNSYSATASYSLSAGDGTKTVRVQYKDLVGNISEYSDTIILDTISPINNAILINKGEEYTPTTSIALEISSNDSMSGVSSMRFSASPVFTSSWQQYNTTSSYDLLSEDGNKTVYAQFKDNAGNVTTSTIYDSIYLDKTPPSASFSINNGATYTNSPYVKLNISATDEVSGLNEMRFTNNSQEFGAVSGGSGWACIDVFSMDYQRNSATAIKNWTLEIPFGQSIIFPVEDGLKTVYAQFMDGLGNATAPGYYEAITSETIKDWIILDATPPSGTITINNGDIYTSNPVATLNLAAVDTMSGISIMRFSNNNVNWSAWEDYSSIKNSWVLSDGDGEKKVYIQYKDNAGNISKIVSDKITYFVPQPPTAPTVVGGQISQDTTWTLANSPYVIDSPSNSGYTLTVNSGVTLTIEPGVVIKLKDNFQRISVLGTLNAVGTKNLPIVFTSFKDDSHAGDTNQDGNLSQPQPGNWNSLNFHYGSQNSQFKNIEVYYGGSSPEYFAVGINGPTLAIDNCRFINNNDGINIAGGAPSTIVNSIFENNRNGIYLRQITDGLIKNNSISDSRQNGIYTHNARALITKNSINNNTNYAIYNQMYEGFSVPTISYNDIFLNGSSSSGDIWNGWYDAGRGDPLVNANYNYWGSSTLGPEYMYGTSNDPWSQFPYTSEGQIYYQALGGLDDSLPYLSRSHSPYKYFGDPVNVSTGNFAHEEKDISIPTKGLPLEFVRYYNSLNSSYKDAQLGYGWTHNYNTALRFDENGAVTVMYPDGKRRTFSFDGNNYIPSQDFKDKLEKNPDGSYTLTFFSQVKYKYNGNGRLISQEDKYGNKTTLVYSGNGYLYQIKAPDFDQSYRNIRIEYNSKQLISKVYEHYSSEAVYFSYDNDDNLISVTTATKGRPWNFEVEGKTTTYTYANHQLETITEPGAANPIVRNTYLDGMVILQNDAHNNTKAFSYDADNSKSIITDNRGYKATHSYNSQFWVTKAIDPLNNATKYNYGDLSKPLEIIDQRGNTSSFSYDVNGNAAEAVDPKGYITKANYDLSNNNLIWQEDALARRTSYSYDATGKFLEKINSPIGTTSFSYYPDGLLKIGADPRGNTTGYNYDSSGNPSRIIDARGASTTLAYSSTGKLTSSQDALGNTTRYGYDYYTDNLTSININGIAPGNDYIRFNYDDRGNLTEFYDHYDNLTKFGYDDMNLLKSVIDANGMSTSYSYDQNYNLSQVVNARSHTISYSYNANNRLSSVIDQLGRTINYFYDASSNLVKTVFPNGDETYYGYDKTNMLTDISYKNDTTSYNLEYNPTSTLKKVTDNTGKEYNYLYDNGDRLTKATDQNNPLISQFAVTMEYDPNSNLTGIKAGNDMTASYSYDQVSNLTGIDLPGGSANEISSTYNLVRNPTQSYTPGTTTSYQYDAANKITNLTNDSKDASYQGLRRIYTYSYDSIGNITKEQFKRTVGANSSNSQTIHTYDKLNRLTDWFNQDNNMTTSYGYDKTGNLLTVKENGATTKSFSYNAADQISNTGYQYDLNGNLKEDSNHLYDYDSENRLEKVTDKVTSQVIAEYTYDFMGRRTSATNSSGATTYFHYNGLTVVAESDGTGAITARYYYDDKGHVQAMERDSNKYYYQFNARGNVVSLTNEQGQIVNEYEYDPWGNPISTNETVSNPYRYAGYRYDSDTGLYYLNARYYSPKNYRFLTPDPEPGVLKSPITQNKYVYANDNPVNFIDDRGDIAYPIVTAAGGAAFGLIGTAVGDIISGEASSWQTYVGNTAGGMAAGAMITANPAMAGAVGGLISESVKQALTGDGFSGRSIGISSARWAISGGIAGKLAPRGPGRWPTKLKTQIFGKISQNIMWKQESIELLLGLPEAALIRAMSDSNRIPELKSAHAR